MAITVSTPGTRDENDSPLTTVDRIIGPLAKDFSAYLNESTGAPESSPALSRVFYEANGGRLEIRNGLQQTAANLGVDLNEVDAQHLSLFSPPLEPRATDRPSSADPMYRLLEFLATLPAIDERCPGRSAKGRVGLLPA